MMARSLTRQTGSARFEDENVASSVATRPHKSDEEGEEKIHEDVDERDSSCLPSQDIESCAWAKNRKGDDTVESAPLEGPPNYFSSYVCVNREERKKAKETSANKRQRVKNGRFASTDLSQEGALEVILKDGALEVIFDSLKEPTLPPIPLEEDELKIARPRELGTFSLGTTPATTPGAYAMAGIEEGRHDPQTEVTEVIGRGAQFTTDDVPAEAEEAAGDDDVPVVAYAVEDLPLVLATQVDGGLEGAENGAAPEEVPPVSPTVTNDKWGAFRNRRVQASFAVALLAVLGLAVSLGVGFPGGNGESSSVSSASSSKDASDPTVASTAAPTQAIYSAPTAHPSTFATITPFSTIYPSMPPTLVPSRATALRSPVPTATPTSTTKVKPTFEPTHDPGISAAPTISHAPTSTSPHTSIPTATPMSLPTPQKTLQVIKNNLGANSYDECQGDCDEDSDCIGDLVCHQRRGSVDGENPVPGCGGLPSASNSNDYCIRAEFNPTAPTVTPIPTMTSPPSPNPTANPTSTPNATPTLEPTHDPAISTAPSVSPAPTSTSLPTPIPTSTPTSAPMPQKTLQVIKNNLGANSYDECQGDCDEDSDCIGDLVCYQRSGSVDGENPVPGCGGLPSASNGNDYCIRAEFNPTSAPTVTPSPTMTAWLQAGDDIDGIGSNDWFGFSVSLSEMGDRLVVGATNHDRDGFTDRGMVQVFMEETQGGNWIQLGEDLLGDSADNYFGEAVSISRDGERIAVGAFFHNAGRGQVKVFEFESGTWQLLGSPLVGEAIGDEFGSSVALSADGNIVAVGAILNNGINGEDSGHVRVFQYANASWNQLGDDIDGEGFDDRSGWAVSLSADGFTVAIGAGGNDGDNSTNSGHVRVYAYERDSWKQVGQDLDGEAELDWSGFSVSLSADGGIVAVGADDNDGTNGVNSGHVRVYEYNQESGKWLQLGDDIDGEAAGDNSGSSVSLSSDGTIVAVGADDNDGNGDGSGHVRIHRFDGNDWVQVGADIDGEAGKDLSGFSLSLSGDGSRVAIGAVRNNANGNSDSGHVRLYNSPAAQ